MSCAVRLSVLTLCPGSCVQSTVMTAMNRMSVGTCMCYCGAACHIAKRLVRARIRCTTAAWRPTTARKHSTTCPGFRGPGEGPPRAGNLMRMGTPCSLRAWLEPGCPCTDVVHVHGGTACCATPCTARSRPLTLGHLGPRPGPPVTHALARVPRSSHLGYLPTHATLEKPTEPRACAVRQGWRYLKNLVIILRRSLPLETSRGEAALAQVPCLSFPPVMLCGPQSGPDPHSFRFGFRSRFRLRLRLRLRLEFGFSCVWAARNWVPADEGPVSGTLPAPGAGQQMLYGPFFPASFATLAITGIASPAGSSSQGLTRVH